MNLSPVISRVLIVAAVVLAGNISAVEFYKPAIVFVGSVLMNEKNSAALFGEEYISARKQVIIGKALVGGLANLNIKFPTLSDVDIPRGADFPDVNKFPFHVEGAGTNKLTIIPTNKVDVTEIGPFVGHVVVNGALRVGGDYFSLDEKFIDKKCDEAFSEDVAWVVKPIVNGLVDFAYDYATVKLVKGFRGGIAKS